MSVCAVCAVGRVDTVSRLQSAIQNNDPTGIEEAIGLSTLPAPVPFSVHLQTPPPPLPHLFVLSRVLVLRLPSSLLTDH
jgi:hypothetical protein